MFMQMIISLVISCAICCPDKVRLVLEFMGVCTRDPWFGLLLGCDFIVVLRGFYLGAWID